MRTRLTHPVHFGVYQHFKHTRAQPRYYLVLTGHAGWKPTESYAAIYMRLYPANLPLVWVNSVYDFLEPKVLPDGSHVRRFTRASWWRLATALWAWPRGRRYLDD